MKQTWRFISDYSLLLISGALMALIWANIAPHSYHAVVDFVLFEGGLIGHLSSDHGHGPGRVLTFHYLVNDVLMAFFFAVAGKEVWEAVILPNGALRGKKSVTPLFATAGGMFGPIAVYLGLALLLGSDTYSAVANGWAIPTATDIAFSYLVGRIIFGRRHPAVTFLLLLAIADDAAGLAILAIFYPSGELHLQWLLLPLAATATVYLLFNWLPRKLDDSRSGNPVSSMIERRLSLVPYAAGGALCWYGFQQSGLHPALGLLPIIVAIPHAGRDYGLFVHAEPKRLDMLNRIEHLLEKPVEVILLLFGLVNAGVELSTFGTPTILVLLGLIVGKPVGIFLFGWVAAGPLRLGMPTGMQASDILVVGFIAAIGFTVSLFIATVAFDPGSVQDAAKMGALLSLGSAGLAFLVARLFPIKKME